MELTGIEKSLHEGCRLHGFLSGGGLRVMRIEQDKVLKGYGEQPHAEDALSDANEDYLAGGRPYDEVYGKLKPHYLTGSSSGASPLDSWMLKGRTIDAYFEQGSIIVDLNGTGVVEIPEEITNKVMKTGQSETWEDRGHTYEIYLTMFPNGEPGWSAKVTRFPNAPDYSRAWFYKIMKRGQADTLDEAIENALKAESVEISKD